MIKEILLSTVINLNQHIPNQYNQADIERYLAETRKTLVQNNTVLYSDTYRMNVNYLFKHYENAELLDYTTAAYCTNNRVVTIIKLLIENQSKEICLSSNGSFSKEINCDNISFLVEKDDLESKIDICRK